MDAFHRLSQLSSTVKERVSPAVWKLAFRLIAGLVFVALLAVIVPRVWELASWFWMASQADRDKVSPLLAPLASVVGTLATLAVGVFSARAALRQAGIATRVAEIAAQQAETAAQRHEAQTKADFRRRITESYSKAVTQLASDKLEERLGGIYTLESISKESSAGYKTRCSRLLDGYGDVDCLRSGTLAAKRTRADGGRFRGTHQQTSLLSMGRKQPSSGSEFQAES